PELNPEINPKLEQELEEQQHHLDKWESLKKISSVVRDGSKRLTSKDVIERTILELCEGQPISLSDLAELLGREGSTLRKTYLNPMVSDGRLSRVYPTKINHPKQGYYKT
ncbi:AAA family ATPase, partial [Colwellia sp. D2M02]|nr:AAA family ATPase [Colwellia sp. D2M02]